MTSQATRQPRFTKETVEPWTAEQSLRLKSAIRAHGTIKDVAAAIPISRQWLTSILAEDKPQSPSVMAFQRVCDVIGVSPAEIINGAVARAELHAPIQSAGPMLAADAKWKNLSEIDITQFTETSEGPTVSQIPFRVDWLNRVLGSEDGVFLARLPAGYEPLNLAEGDMVFVETVRHKDLIERAIYIWRRDMMLFVARLGEPRGSDRPGEQYVSRAEVGVDDGKAQAMWRVRGVTMKGI